MKMTVASPTPFHTSTRAMENIARLGLVSQPGPSMPTAASALLIRPCLRVHQDGEGESDADGADQHGEEDDRAQVAASDDLRGQQQGQRHAEDDLEPGGDHRIDQRVAQADDQRLLVRRRSGSSSSRSSVEVNRSHRVKEK